MKITLNLLVATDVDGNISTVEPVKSSTPAEAHKEYGFSDEEKALRVCQVVLEDETGAGYMGNVATAYQAAMGIDDMCGYPSMRDTLMFFFREGFLNGMKYQAEQEAAKPTVVVP